MARIKIFDSASKTWIYADHAFGKDGADGKSAYEYAKDAGFTGTEAEFAQKLIEDNAVKTIPQELTDSQKSQARENIGAVSVSDIPSFENLATYNYVDNKIANLVNSAPETLDTLGELATAMEENESVVNALNQAIANKADSSTVTQLQEIVNAKAENDALNEHTSNTTIHITAVERAAWNSKMDGDSELISIADIDTICGSVAPIAEVLF